MKQKTQTNAMLVSHGISFGVLDILCGCNDVDVSTTQSYFLISNYTFINSYDEIRIHNPLHSFIFQSRSFLSRHALHQLLLLSILLPSMLIIHRCFHYIFMHSNHHHKHNRLCCASQVNHQQNKTNLIAFQMDSLSSHKLQIYMMRKRKRKKGMKKNA